jgi:hypothetical protein
MARVVAGTVITLTVEATLSILAAPPATHGNLSRARALGLVIPPSLRQAADWPIE